MNPLDNQIIDENANYVLGMYDLYQHDQEIIDALRMKGLDNRMTHLVLDKIKAKAYEKRIKQAKRNILIGSILVLLFFIIPYSVILLSGSDFSGPNSLLHGKKAGEGMLRSLLHFYSYIYVYVNIAGLLQIIAGVTSLFKYKKLLKAIQ